MAVDYGLDASCTLCTTRLEMPDGSFRTLKAVQLSLGFATDDAGRTIPESVSGRSGLAEALVRRLTSSRGTLLDVVTPPSPQVSYYGNDVTQYANDDLSARQIAQVGAGVDAEMRKDERVVQSQTQATFAGNVLLIPINITDGVGPFSLVLAVGNVTTTLLSAPT